MYIFFFIECENPSENYRKYIVISPESRRRCTRVKSYGRLSSDKTERFRRTEIDRNRYVTICQKKNQRRRAFNRSSGQIDYNRVLTTLLPDAKRLVNVRQYSRVVNYRYAALRIICFSSFDKINGIRCPPCLYAN